MQTKSYNLPAARPRPVFRQETAIVDCGARAKPTTGLLKSIRKTATQLYKRAPLATNVVMTAGIGITSAAISAAVAPATVPLAMTALALGGGTLACCATLNDGDGLDQAVRTFVGGAAASLWGPAAAAEGIAAGLFLGGLSAMMLDRED